jgi:UDP:flavonoid glycosyltransferase YjiC (YdhE family)
MRILFTSLRTTSHFLPLVPFLNACRKRGHEVAVAAPAELAARVAETGAAFFPFGHPGDEGLRPIWERQHRAASEEEATRLAIGELFAGICAKTALPGLLETMQRWRPALVVRESQEYAAVIAAERVAIPHVRVAIMMSSSEGDVLGAAAPPLDAHGQSVGLQPDPSGRRLLDELSLSLFPRSLELPGVPLPRVLRFRAQQQQAAPLPPWWNTPAGPLVYLTLGTVMGSMEVMRSAYRVVLDAVASLRCRVLLTTGSQLPPEALGDIPENVHVERFIPQADVLPHAAAVVCHGGSGTVIGALAAGVPLVVAPMFADQPLNAARVAAIGAGLALPPRAASAGDLRAALSRVLGESAFAEAARRVATEIAALPPVDEAALELERLP